jgi:uncharacterized membrane protein
VNHLWFWLKTQTPMCKCQINTAWLIRINNSQRAKQTIHVSALRLICSIPVIITDFHCLNGLLLHFSLENWWIIHRHYEQMMISCWPIWPWTGWRRSGLFVCLYWVQKRARNWSKYRFIGEPITATISQIEVRIILYFVTPHHLAAFKICRIRFTRS